MTQDQIILGIIQDIAELPNRTSPDDAPEMMLVNASELRRILEHRLPDYRARGPFTAGQRVHHLGRVEDGTVSRVDREGTVCVDFDVGSPGIFDANWFRTVNALRAVER